MQMCHQIIEISLKSYRDSSKYFRSKEFGLSYLGQNSVVVLEF